MKKTKLDLLFEAIRCYGGVEAEKYARQYNESSSALSVSDMFSWKVTPQGLDYWRYIAYKAYVYSLMSPRDRLAERIEHEFGKPKLAQYVRDRDEFINAAEFHKIAKAFSEVSSVELDCSATVELWWQKRDREAREQRDQIVTLRRAVRNVTLGEN